MRLCALVGVLALAISGCTSDHSSRGDSQRVVRARSAAAPSVYRDPKSPDVLAPPPVAGNPPPMITITPPSIAVAPVPPRTAAQIKADCQAKAKTMKFGIHWWKRHKWIAMCRKQAAGT